MITVDEFFRVEIRVGKVILAENVDKSDKLIRLKVSFGEDEERTIFTGVRTYGYKPEDFSDKQFLFVTNIEPKMIMGEASQGMILAVGEEKPIFVGAEDLPVGAVVR